MMAAVPSVGASASHPGHISAASKNKALARIATRPVQASTRDTVWVIRDASGTAIARSAPIPSSHKRVVVTKNARAGSSLLITTDHTKDETTSALITTAASARRRAPVLRTA